MFEIHFCASFCCDIITIIILRIGVEKMKPKNRFRDIVIPALLFCLLIYAFLFDGLYTKIALYISIILNIIYTYLMYFKKDRKK